MVHDGTYRISTSDNYGAVCVSLCSNFRTDCACTDTSSHQLAIERTRCRFEIVNKLDAFDIMSPDPEIVSIPAFSQQEIMVDLR